MNLYIRKVDLLKSFKKSSSTQKRTNIAILQYASEFTDKKIDLLIIRFCRMPVKLLMREKTQIYLKEKRAKGKWVFILEEQ